MLTTACCLVVGLGLGLDYSVWLFGGYAYVFILLSVAIVNLRTAFLYTRVTTT